MSAPVADTSELARFGAQLRASSVAATARARGVTRHYGFLLVTAVKRNVSGRPGPRAITGDYRRSWGMEMSGNAAVSTATVATNRPMARRLELGFYGEDSLGRVVESPPYPHAGPAVDEVGPHFEEAVASIADGVLED